MRSPSRLFPALQHRDFALFWGANVVSRLGTQMRDVALAWQIYLLTHSPLALGLLGAARAIPAMSLALLGGATADALDRRRVMIVSQVVLTVLSLVMTVLTYSKIATPLALYLLSAVAGAANAFDNPARQSLVVNLLPERDLPSGLSLQIWGVQLASVIGPAIGGLLLAATSIEAIYLIDTLSFGAVIAALLAVRVRHERRKADQTRGKVDLSAVLDGLRFLRTKPVLIWLMVLDFLARFFAGSMLLLPIFASEIFHVGERGLGLLSSAPAAGSLVASAWMSARGPIRHQGATALLAVAAFGACIALFGVCAYFPLALLLLAGSGAADTLSMIVRQIARHTMTPDELRGRLTSINMIFFTGGPQLGELEAGIVAGLTNVRVSVVSGGVACVAVALIVAAAVPALRSLQSETRSA